MQHFQPARCSLWLVGLLFYLFCLCSCSSLKVDVSPALDWSRVSTVSVQPPPQDPWELSPVVSSELRLMGLRVLTGEGAAPDLLVRFFVKEVPDLNADGLRLTRLQSFHLQFIDPASDKTVGVADYFYPITEARPSPADGVAAAFTGLRKNLSRDKSSTQPHAEKAGAVTRQTTVPSAATTPPSSSARHQNAPIGKALPHTPLPHHPPGELTAPTGKKVQDSAPDDKSTPEQSDPVADQPKVKEIVPQTNSPWIPRLKSWGFDNWGKETGDDY